MKQLILNADDFGLSTGTNLAIIKAWRDGLLTSASLMVSGEGFDHAVQLAKENPGLQIGLHLTLVQGKAVKFHSGFPSLVDSSGEFSDDPVHSGMRYFFINKLKKQLDEEIEAQIVEFLKTGIPLSHIDGHLNIHMHPTIFDILSRLMPRYGISSFRLSRERLVEDLKISPRRFLGKFMDSFIFDKLSNRCKPVLDRLGISYATEVKGLLNSGRMTEDYLSRSLDLLQDGLTEIYFHPGYLPDPEISRRMPDYHHEEELAALLSPKIRGRIVSEGIILKNYRGDSKIC